jgi:plasmid stabilization system protein ParE
MVSYRFHSEADEEYIATALWYLAISVRVTIRFVQTIDNAILKIRTMPQAYPRYDRRHRAFVVKRFPYYIVYREEADGVIIVAVAHNSRRPGYWKGR